MSRILSHFFIVSIVVSGACSIRSGDQTASSTPLPSPTATASAQPSATPDATPEETAGQSATLQCQNLKAGKHKVYKKQTFAIDFEPFRNSCFVSTFDPEYGSDPPVQSEYAIYKNGEKVYDFPGQFNGANFGCWVDAVSFQDLNADKRNDVIVIGKCSGKSDTYNENSVFINDGNGFATRDDANMQLNEFTTIKQVAGFVEENRSMFF